MTEMTVDEALILEIMGEHPGLTAFGMGIYRELTAPIRKEREREFEEEREALRRSVDDIVWTVQWLERNIQPIKSVNMKHSSYRLKHIAEVTSPNHYLYNGVFILAALALGYPAKIPKPNEYGIYLKPNVHFGMSERSIEKARIAAREVREQRAREHAEEGRRL